MPQKGQKLKPGSLKGGSNQPSSKAKAGEGGRFQALKRKLVAKGDVRDPEAVAAAIGRAKFGKKKFQQMAKRGNSEIGHIVNGYGDGFSQMLTTVGMPVPIISEITKQAVALAFSQLYA